MKSITRIFIISLFIMTMAAQKTSAIGSVQVIGKSIDSTALVYGINIPLPNLVDSIVVEVIYGAGSPGACNFIYGNAQYAPAAAALSNAANPGNGLPPKGVFRHTFAKDATNPTQIFANVQNAINGASFIIYIYRPMGSAPPHTVVYPHHADVYHARQSTITRTAASPYCMGDYKNISIAIPLINKHANRPINIVVQTGTQIITRQFTTPAQPGLHIAYIVVPNVYCFDTQLQIKVQSPTPANGIEGDEIITGSMVIDVQQTENILPVEMVYFDAKINKKTIEIQWQTATEQSSSHFEIQKTININDKNTIETIAKITAQGNKITATKYQHTDTQPTEGDSYYRLIQTDMDGKQHTYNWIKTTYATTQKALQATIYPSPATTQNLQLSLHAQANDAINISIYNTQGQIIYTQQLTVQAAQTTVNLSNILPTGIFIIKIQTNDDTITQKFVVGQ